MSKVHALKGVQNLPISIEECWKFFSDPHNLPVLTPDFLNLKMTNELYGDRAYAGQVMTYTVKPLLGIPLAWMTEITHVEPMKLFVDEQRKGPYKLWHHQHHFKPIEGGVEMTDLVHYRLPFFFLGDMVHEPIVKKKLNEIFQFRFQKISELFGSWPGAKMNLQID
ncbi:MAG: SRPBCC family protein [Chitinophagaceae bacterium]